MVAEGYKFAQSEAKFRQAVEHIWMKGYARRGRVVDSSGFEHAIIGEFDPRKDSVSGLHNWSPTLSSHPAFLAFRSFLAVQEGLL